MVFSSVTFLFYFFPLFLSIYLLLPFRNVTILVFSIIFYAWGEPRFLPIIFVYIIIDYLLGNIINKPSASRRRWLVIGVCANVGLLIYFKYMNFLTGQMSILWVWMHLGTLPVSSIPLPLGISFITFQGVSYLVDVYRGDVTPQRSLLNFAMYKSMFPQLIAGPIVRYSDVADVINDRTVTIGDIVVGAHQFVVGLVQKVLIANVLAGPADDIFAIPPDRLDLTTSWVGILCYTLQIFYDFAGYSNMAIGLGRVLGFRYPANFNQPYASESVTEFWRRWHMTLSRWFRDYVYFPLGGNRISTGRTYTNLMTVFLLCGAWHGANWTFIFWGAYHGTFLILERLGLNAILQRLSRPVRHLYLIVVVMVGWVFFRADTLSHAFKFLSAMVGAGDGSSLTPAARYLSPEVCAALVVGAVLATISAGKLLSVVAVPERLRYPGAYVSLVALLVVCLLEVSAGAYNPFIYYRF